MIENRDENEPSPQELTWSGMTHRGKVRPNNEDAFLALTFDMHDVRYLGKVGQSSYQAGDYVFAVSDGMGGAKSGEFASRIAVDKITHLMPRSYKMVLAGFSAGFEDVLTELFTRIHHELMRLAHSYDECAGMGATLSLSWFTPGWMFFGHVGDSRIYHLPREGGMRQLTHDDTHVGWLRRTGQINEREQRMHPRRNALQKALGAGHQIVDPQLGAVQCRRGDRFLLCTDGVVDGLWDRALQDTIREPGMDQRPDAWRVVETAVAESGRDNATAMVISMN